MTHRHWLDPMARQLLRITGHLPRAKNADRASKKFIDKELEKIKSNQRNLKGKHSFLIDVNRATSSELRQLPGCTESMIELITKLQDGGVQFSREEDLFQLLELPTITAKEWSPHLIFRWYGDSPLINKINLIDINSASSISLQNKLKWSDQRLKRLIRERQRCPFKDLADLQERLTLPASCVEKLIGVVRFSNKKAGPILPPHY